MQLTSNKERVDNLIKHFWQNGYMTVSRKFGTYLPSPNPVGTYDVDAVGRYDKKFAFGIILTPSEIENGETPNKIVYLATRQTKFSNTKVTLFIGVETEYASQVKAMVDVLPEDVKRNIKIVLLSEKRFSRSVAV